MHDLETRYAASADGHVAGSMIWFADRGVRPLGGARLFAVESRSAV